MSTQATFDYIIVGSGSAGCVLAHRLSEDEHVRVLVLEAGGWDRDPWIHIPLGWGQIVNNRKHDWGYDSDPEPGVNGRTVECMRGKVIGGCSSINAMSYVRGHRTDYDRWAAGGLDGWSYAHALPYLRKQESWEGGSSEYRGGDGPIATRASRYEDPLIEAWIDAGKSAGQPYTPDYNGAQQEGFSRLQSMIRKGMRDSGARAYLRPALGRPNLKLEIEAHVTRVLMDGTRAIGVEYVQRGRTVTAHAAKEVILAGGVINSPQLLMLSGVGDPEQLARHSIPVKSSLAGVGKNLQDHVGALVSYSRISPGTFQRSMRLDRITVALARAWMFGTGFATDLPSGVVAFLKTDSSLPAPDMQMLFYAGPAFDGLPYLPPFKPAFEDGFSCRVVLLRPESRGQVTLASGDPMAKVRIKQNFLSTDRDMNTLRAAVQLIRNIGRESPLAPFVAKELAPGSSDRGALDALIRSSSITVHHPVGTCRMGLASDPGAVVDDQLRVHGIDGLRVVDASVMPDIVGGNVNATVVMIAERASDLIRGRTPLAPARVAAA